MDVEVIILSEVRQRQILYDSTERVESKKSDKGIYIQKRNRLTDTGNKLIVTKGGGAQGGIN